MVCIYYNESFYIMAPNFATRLFLPTPPKSLDFVPPFCQKRRRRKTVPAVPGVPLGSPLILLSGWCGWRLPGAVLSGVSGERLPRVHSPSGLGEGPPGSHAAPC